MNQLQEGIKHFQKVWHDIFNIKNNHEFSIDDKIIKSIVEIVNEIYQEKNMKHFMAEYYNMNLSQSLRCIRSYSEYEIIYNYNEPESVEFISDNRLAIECSATHKYTADEYNPVVNIHMPSIVGYNVTRAYERAREMLIIPRSIYYIYQGSSIIPNNTRNYIKDQIKHYILNKILIDNSLVLSNVEIKYNERIKLEKEILKAMCRDIKNSVTIEIDKNNSNNTESSKSEYDSINSYKEEYANGNTEKGN